MNLGDKLIIKVQSKFMIKDSFKSKQAFQPEFGKFTKFESLHIDRKQWHQLKNETDNPLKIIDILNFL